jgi:hypothetical protein
MFLFRTNARGLRASTKKQNEHSTADSGVPAARRGSLAGRRPRMSIFNAGSEPRLVAGEEGVGLSPVERDACAEELSAVTTATSSAAPSPVSRRTRRSSVPERMSMWQGEVADDPSALRALASLVRPSSASVTSLPSLRV